MENVSSLPGLAKELVVFLSGLSILGIVLNQIGTARERQRQEYARALQIAVKWVELPYRIHRRQEDTAVTRAAIASTIHELQEDFGFYDAWLSVEAPRVAEAYQRLVTKVRGETREHIQNAWKVTPSVESSMNIGQRYPADYKAEQEAFVEAVRLHLRLFGIQEFFDGRLKWFRR